MLRNVEKRGVHAARSSAQVPSPELSGESGESKHPCQCNPLPQLRLRGLDLTRQVAFGAAFPLSAPIGGAWPDRFSMPVLCLLSLISRNSPKQLDMVSLNSEALRARQAGRRPGAIARGRPRPLRLRLCRLAGRRPDLAQRRAERNEELLRLAEALADLPDPDARGRGTEALPRGGRYRRSPSG